MCVKKRNEVAYIYKIFETTLRFTHIAVIYLYFAMFFANKQLKKIYIYLFIFFGKEIRRESVVLKRNIDITFL